MSNFLFIVTEIKSANGICCKAVMDEIVLRGHKVFCITNHESNMKKEFINDNIRFFTIKPRFTYRLNSFIQDNKHGKFKKKILLIIFKILNKVKLIFSIMTWPLISPMYSKRIFNKASRICKENEIECIIPIYTQIDTLIAAKKIKDKFPNKKYVPYFLDSLSGGYGPKKFSKEWTIKRGLKWEKKLLPAADKIIMMESSKEHYKIYSSMESYYKKIKFLDLPLFTSTNNVTKNKKEENINIYYVGTLPEGIRSPEYFLKVFSKIKEEKIQLYFIGTKSCNLLNKYAKEDSRIHVLGKCSHEEAIEFLKKADILLNIGNTNIQMTPSKIFEYMSFGKPIISTCPIENEPSEKYLKEYPVKYFMKEDLNKLETHVNDLKKFIIKNYKIQFDTEFLNDVFLKNTPKATADEIINTFYE